LSEYSPSRATMEELRRERDRAQRYLEIAEVILLALNEKGEITLLNRKGCEILGCRESDVQGRSWFDTFIPEMERERVKETFARLIAGEQQAVEYFQNDVIALTGERRTIAWHNKMLEDDRGRIIGTLSSGQDITDSLRIEQEQRRLEAQIRHTQKLESLGVLAGGIAHDFNNILQVIIGNVTLAEDHVSQISPARENLDEIGRAARRASDLCHQMLAYSGKGKFVVEAVDLNAIVREMTHMLEISISKKAELRFDLADVLPAVEADPTQLRQVILNLITNASESLEDRSGVISIATSAEDCDRPDLGGTFLAPDLPVGRYVCLKVADTGCGMDEATCEKIFEPFFSTKFAGRGLGLAAVLGIVRGHRGTIHVDSTPGRGTTFRVLLPASERPAAPITLQAATSRGWQGSGLVLLVDDEVAIRELGRRMLERVGMQVLLAADGRKALEIFRARSREIACVVLDLTMPRLGGEEVLQDMRRIREDVKVILCSGYNEQDITQRFLGQGLAGFLQKPYLPVQLYAKLQEVLGRGR
jgi:two-component system cell cycle sensor histidine kinase/response regulator CckA